MPNRFKRLLLLASVIAGLCALFAVLPATVDASPGGRTGRTGADGSTCSSCHGGGQTPMVAVTGDTVVAPGETVQYMLAITSAAPTTQVEAGWNVTVRDSENVATFAGTIGLVTGDTKSQVSSSELTHDAPLDNVDGVALVPFEWTAPSEEGSYTMYFVGNSVNDNRDEGDGRTGDAAAAGTLEITVSVPTSVSLTENSAENSASYLPLLPFLLLLTLFFVISNRNND